VPRRVRRRWRWAPAERRVSRVNELKDVTAAGAPGAVRVLRDAREETLVDGASTVEAQEAPTLARTVEALLFLSSDPLSPAELADATEAGEGAVLTALAVLGEQYAPGRRGIMLRELGGGWTLASDPATEDAARRLFSRPRASTLSPAQAETLAIVAYLQPISRPEITRIRGVSADSASATLLDRGLIEEAGHSQFGAVLYRTTTQFLKLFGLRSLEELPDIARWDPTPEEQAELRERLLRAGEARAGGGA
jgi:segregation and condensation protein B